MAKQKTAQKPQKQYLNVKHIEMPDGSPSPVTIVTDDEEYPVAVIRFKELDLRRMRFTVEVSGRQFYLYHEMGEWWAE